MTDDGARIERAFKRDELVGQKIVQILTKSSLLDDYPYLSICFLVENGNSFALSAITDTGVYENLPTPEHNNWNCPQIIGKQISGFYYLIDDDGFAKFDSMFVELHDGTWFAHGVCAPPGTGGADVFIYPRSKIDSFTDRLRNYFETPPVLPPVD